LNIGLPVLVKILQNPGQTHNEFKFSPLASPPKPHLSAFETPTVHPRRRPASPAWFSFMVSGPIRPTFELVAHPRIVAL
jgi:hypothetical protein